MALVLLEKGIWQSKDGTLGSTSWREGVEDISWIRRDMVRDGEGKESENEIGWKLKRKNDRENMARILTDRRRGVTYGQEWDRRRRR